MCQNALRFVHPFGTRIRSGPFGMSIWKLTKTTSLAITIYDREYSKTDQDRLSWERTGNVRKLTKTACLGRGLHPILRYLAFSFLVGSSLDPITRRGSSFSLEISDLHVGIVSFSSSADLSRFLIVRGFLSRNPSSRNGSAMGALLESRCVGFHHENRIKTINLICRILLFENPPFCPLK